MDRVEALVIDSDGKQIDVDLTALLKRLLEFSTASIVRFDPSENTLYFECSEFDLFFPRENNRFSIVRVRKSYYNLLMEVARACDGTNLLVSIPGYEHTVELSSTTESIRELLGL